MLQTEAYDSYMQAVLRLYATNYIQTNWAWTETEKKNSVTNLGPSHCTM